MLDARKIYIYAYGRTSALSGRHLDKGEALLKTFMDRARNADGNNSQFNAPNWQAAARWRLGTIYEIRGQKDLARDVYQKGLTFDPEYESLKDALAKLEE